MLFSTQVQIDQMLKSCGFVVVVVVVVVVFVVVVVVVVVVLLLFFLHRYKWIKC